MLNFFPHFMTSQSGPHCIHLTAYSPPASPLFPSPLSQTPEGELRPSTLPFAPHPDSNPNYPKQELTIVGGRQFDGVDPIPGFLRRCVRPFLLLVSSRCFPWSGHLMLFRKRKVPLFFVLLTLVRLLVDIVSACVGAFAAL